MKVLFVGYGNMGEKLSLMACLHQKSFVAENIDIVLSQSSSKAAALRSQFAVNVLF